MIKTTLFIQASNHEDIKVDTDLEFNMAIDLVLKKVPIALFDVLYLPKQILAVDVTENTIEFLGEEI